jgi:hypothetical protein
MTIDTSIMKAVAIHVVVELQKETTGVVLVFFVIIVFFCGRFGLR